MKPIPLVPEVKASFCHADIYHTIYHRLFNLVATLFIE